MDSHVFQAVAAAAAALLLFLTYHSLAFVAGKKLPKGTRLPPGPPGKPFVGNLFDIPPEHSWLKFKQWSDLYGPLFRLNIAGRENYVVSSEKIANDLLRERGNLYSSREQLPAAAELLGDNLRPLFLPYGSLWRRTRKLMHQLTMPSAATTYQPTQVLESTRLLDDLIRAPQDYQKWFARYSSSVIFRLGFGKTMQDEDVLRRIMDVNHSLERVASPGSYLVDTFPSLMHLPDALAPFKRELKQLHEAELGLFRELLDDVKKQMDQNVAPHCWERTFIEQQESYDLTTDQGAYVIGTLFEAGSGTTTAALQSFVLAMVHHPEWMSKIQQEVDEVVGTSRLPEFEDMPSLPTVRAVIKETMRWRPVTAGGLPHQLVKDDVYNGFFLPAGTNIHPNQWAIHREPSLYPDPEVFNPDRWLDPSFPTFKEPLTVHPNIQNYSCFGFGRRICPGQNIAERSLNILVARIAWACDISKAKDEHGNYVDVPLYDYVSGFNTHPKPFQFYLKARSPHHAIIVRSALEKETQSDPLAGK